LSCVTPADCTSTKANSDKYPSLGISHLCGDEAKKDETKEAKDKDDDKDCDKDDDRDECNAMKLLTLGGSLLATATLLY